MRDPRPRTPILLALGLVAALSLGHPAPAAAFNDEYMFAATRGVDRMDVHPALKVPLFPLSVAVDVLFLPFAVVAGLVS